MGYRIRQIVSSGLEGSGGYNYVAAEVDTAADFAAMTAFQDGSVGWIKGDPDTLYLKLAGTWTLMGKSPLGAGHRLEFDGVDPYTLLMANKLFPRRAETTAEIAAAIAPLVETDKRQYYIRAAAPTLEADQFEGMILYNTTDHTLKCCTTPGEQELDTLTVTGPAATKLGNITIKLNTEDTVVAVLKDDTAAQIAAKIKIAVDAAVAAETIAAWTVTCVGAVLTFKKDVIGACSAPTAVDTDGTGATFSAFTRTNQGVAAVWGICINAA